MQNRARGALIKFIFLLQCCNLKVDSDGEADSKVACRMMSYYEIFSKAPGKDSIKAELAKDAGKFL